MVKSGKTLSEMLHFDQIGPRTEKTIAKLLSQWLSNHPLRGLSANRNLRLGESFTTTTLPHGIDESLEPVLTGTWVHLLRASNRYVGYGLSKTAGPSERHWQIEAVFRASLAARLARCISWLEKSHGDVTGIVRLLIVPPYDLYAFTITHRKIVGIVVVPPALGLKKLRPRHLYSWNDFRKSLVHEVSISGVATHQSQLVNRPRIIQ